MYSSSFRFPAPSLDGFGFNLHIRHPTRLPSPIRNRRVVHSHSLPHVDTGFTAHWVLHHNRVSLDWYQGMPLCHIIGASNDPEVYISRGTELISTMPFMISFLNCVQILPKLSTGMKWSVRWLFCSKLTILRSWKSYDFQLEMLFMLTFTLMWSSSTMFSLEISNLSYPWLSQNSTSALKNQYFHGNI